MSNTSRSVKAAATAVALLLAAFGHAGAAELEQGMPLGMLVGPYLQWPTQTGMTIRWETSIPASSVVEWGETSPPLKRAAVEGNAQYHEVPLSGLKPETQYFYRVISRDGDGLEVKSQVLTLRTAVRPDSPFAFVVISDSQENPAVVRKIAEMAYAQRPNFTLHCGDLVSDGRIKEHWTGHYFPNSAVLNQRVPLLPMLGTHEKNAHFFYDYFSLPAPKYYYKFNYGNADFFVLDSQRDVGPNSEQYRWLKNALASSRATWKIVAHHDPPYSSDENDYGDTYKTTSTWGDMEIRRLVPLYDKYGVDVVWGGHIHTYERTLPLRAGKVVEKGRSSDIFDNAYHPYTIGLLNSILDIDPERAREKGIFSVEGETPSSVTPPSGCRFHPRCPLVEDACRVEEPPMVAISDEHQVACPVSPRKFRDTELDRKVIYEL